MIMTEILDIEREEQKGIPMFLKVLCILTFIGAGIGILSGLWNLLTFQTTLATLQASQEMLGGFYGDMSELIEVTKKWGFLAHILTLLGAALCLVGALMMWKLKKTGFYIYVVGQILPLIASFGLMGGLTSSGGLFASMAIVGMILGTLFPIAFIVMYGLNLKHMR
jgi:hypothetical protein